MSGTQPAKYTPQQNVNDRGVLLSTGVAMTINLGTYGPFAAGQTVPIKVRNIGVITKFRMRVSATATITAAATASPLGPYPMLSRIVFSDYNTTQRVNASGAMNYFLNSIRHGRPWMPTGQGLIDTAQTEQPVTTAGGTIQCSYDIPIAYDPTNDLSGGILAQTVVGEMYLQLTCNATAVGDPLACPYTAGTVALSAFYIEVWQDYIQPQGSTIPKLDLNTVYEQNGMFTSYDNITAGGTKYIDYPNVRSVKGFYLVYVDNGALTVNGTDISSLILIANGNTQMRQMDPLLIRKDMRNMLGGDLPAALYYIGSRRQPIQTWIYSQVQEAITFAAASGTPYVAYMFESLYPLNTPLPGVAAGS